MSSQVSRSSRLRNRNSTRMIALRVENAIDILWDKIDDLTKTVDSVQEMIVKMNKIEKKEKNKKAKALHLQIDAKLKETEPGVFEFDFQEPADQISDEIINLESVENSPK